MEIWTPEKYQAYIRGEKEETEDIKKLYEDMCKEYEKLETECNDLKKYIKRKEKKQIELIRELEEEKQKAIERQKARNAFTIVLILFSILIIFITLIK